MITQESRERIEKLRTTTSSQDLEFLKRTQANITGVTPQTGCFCKSTNMIKFRDQFFLWFDQYVQGNE